MPIKHSLKIFASKFSMIWNILFYFLFVGIILFCISLFALVPVYEYFYDNGIIDNASELIMQFIVNGYSRELVDSAIGLINNLSSLIISNPDILTVLVLYLILVVGLLARFFVGIIELPLLKKFQGALSDNANYNFSGIFISELGRSMLYSVVKTMIKFVSDCAVYALLYLITVAMISIDLYLFVPFVLVIFLIVYYAFKYGICAYWGTTIAVDDKSIFVALGYSVKKFFKYFKKLFSLYVIVWLLLILANYVVLRYTFGAGLVVAVPISLLIINAINITFYYDMKKYRYYVSNDVIDPTNK